MEKHTKQNKQTKSQKLHKGTKCKNNLISPMSNAACCDLNNKIIISRMHDYCPNPKCKCQKQNIFTPKQFGI